MMSFQILLTKSYPVSINAENEEAAKRCAEFFTGDISDLSNAQDREENKFSIENIECTINQAFEAEEV